MPRTRPARFPPLAALAWCLGLLAPAAAGAGTTIESVIVVGRSAPGEPWTDGPTLARPADGAELAIVAEAREGSRRRRVVYLVDAAVAPLVVDGETVPDDARRPWADAGDVAVRWSYVEPHAWRPEDVVAPNGTTTRYYSNVVSGGPRHGRWLGYDRIVYFETPIGDWSTDAAARRRAATASPPRPEDDVWEGLGTMRYKAEVLGADGTVVASPGADATDAYGILPSVHRVSMRADDSFVGWLSSYFMVPEVFGSAGTGANSQAERYVGADCADVLVGALRASGHTRPPYSNVAALTDYADPVGGPAELGSDGLPVSAEDEIAGVQAGDIVRIDYGGDWSGATPRSWDHVAVVWEDRSDPDGPEAGEADGKLDGFDLVAHMGHPHLVVAPLSTQTPARVDVLRWNERRID